MDGQPCMHRRRGVAGWQAGAGKSVPYSRSRGDLHDSLLRQVLPMYCVISWPRSRMPGIPITPMLPLPVRQILPEEHDVRLDGLVALGAPA